MFLYALFRYIYTDSVTLESFDQVSGLLYAAQKYKVPELVDKCFQFGWDHPVPSNVCSALEHAILYENKLLQVLNQI